MLGMDHQNSSVPRNVSAIADSRKLEPKEPTMPAPEREPPDIGISITSPAAGAVLSGSRAGDGDVVQFETSAFDATVTGVSVLIEQPPGAAQRRVSATRGTG